MRSSNGQGSLLGDGLEYFVREIKEYTRENSLVVFASVIGVLIVTIYVVSKSWSNLSWIFGN